MKNSRRSFFRYLSVLGIGCLYTAPLYAKTKKEVVKYQSTPFEGKSCKECLHFISTTNECRTVEGNIDPDGWCNIYFKNPNYIAEKKENNTSKP